MFNNKDTSSKKGKGLEGVGQDLNLIGVGTSINGDINSAGDLRIDGTVKGSVSSKARLVLGPNGKIDGDIHPNDSEIESIRFISATSLDDELQEHPQRFTPWFIREWQALKESYAGQLARYAM